METVVLLKYWVKKLIHKHSKELSLRGFTLAELLIALTILGIIATFTIPKILQSEQNGKYKATAKEAVSMISEAYGVYQFEKGANSTATFANLTPYMNYVKVDTVSQPKTLGASTDDCSVAGRTCLQLHSGGLLWSSNSRNFGGTGPSNANFFHFNPTPGYNQSDALRIFLYYNGRIASWASIDTNTCNSQNCQNPTADPSWFSWN